MVREISGFHIDIETREPDRPDLPDRDFDRQLVRNSDLVEAFTRFVSARSGSFERLFKLWVSNRVKGNLPVDLDDPDSLTVPASLRKAFEAAFARTRQKPKPK